MNNCTIKNDFYDLLVISYPFRSSDSIIKEAKEIAQSRYYNPDSIIIDELMKTVNFTGVVCPHQDEIISLLISEDGLLPFDFEVLIAARYIRDTSERLDISIDQWWKDNSKYVKDVLEQEIYSVVKSNKALLYKYQDGVRRRSK